MDIWKKSKLKSKTDFENTEENSVMIGKIWKKIVK